MILPSHEDCVRILEELQDEKSLTVWEADFIESNLDAGRKHFSDRQREIIGGFKEKYDV